MDDVLKLKDQQVKKDYGYVATRKADSVYDIDNIEYEIVLEGDEEISDDRWNKIVDKIKVYNMDGSDATITNWTQYIVFVFRATRYNNATEIEVEYIKDGVFSPPKKKDEEEKKEEEVKEIVLKAEKVSSENNKYKLYFHIPENKGTIQILNFKINIKDNIQSFDLPENIYIMTDEKEELVTEGEKDFLVNKKYETKFTIGNITTDNDIKNIIGDNNSLYYVENGRAVVQNVLFK